MTISQIKGMLNFHKRAYLAYKASGNPKAIDARKHMITMYLKLRATRKVG